MRKIYFLVFISSLTSLAVSQEGIDVALGLTIRQVADDDLVPDCTTIAVDPRGRIAASGPGYIRVLTDPNKDGLFDGEQTLVDGPSHGAHGLCFDGDTLFYVGDNGVWKVDLANDSTPTRVLEIKTGGEHDAHALRKGPDGYWYLIAGNGTKDMYELHRNCHHEMAVTHRAAAPAMPDPVRSAPGSIPCP